MRILRYFSGLAMALALPLLCNAADQSANVALQYHFVGAAQLAGNTNAAAAKSIFALGSTTNYANLVLGRLSVILTESLSFPTNMDTVRLLQPLLEDVLRDESMVSMGGTVGQPFSYVLAVHLGAGRLQAWQQSLQALSGGKGEKFQAEKSSGWLWNKGATNEFWALPAGDWMVLGRGKGLPEVRSDYLKQIRENDRPAPALDADVFEADVDWPRLANWIPLEDFPLKLGRTQIAISAEQGGFYMTSHVTYPAAIDWQPHPMNVPTNLVREPLLSFCTGQNVKPFLKSDGLAQFATDPFADQFYFWSMSEIAFQSYFAWPVKDPSSTLAALAPQIEKQFNPFLQNFNRTYFLWAPQTLQLIWKGITLIAPQIAPAPEGDGSYLVASLFPVTPGKGEAPNSLFAEIENRSDLIYYDWELTGPRVRHLLTVTQVVPVIRLLGIGPLRGIRKENSLGGPTMRMRLDIEEKWLEDVSSHLDNTVTEATKTGPNEVTILRHSPFIFSSLELVLLSHWLTDTPSGPLDWSLLPQAKMTRGGLPAPPPSR